MRSRIRWFRAITVVCGVTMLDGCYVYSTVSATGVDVGSEVRAHVTAAEADRAERLLGYRATTVEGRVMQRHADGELLVRVPGHVFSRGGQTQRYYQQLRLAPADVLDLETHTLSVRRTGTLVAVGVAALALIVKSAFTGHTGGSQPIVPGGPQHAIVMPIH